MRKAIENLTDVFYGLMVVVVYTATFYAWEIPTDRPAEIAERLCVGLASAMSDDPDSIEIRHRGVEERPYGSENDEGAGVVLTATLNLTRREGEATRRRQVECVIVRTTADAPRRAPVLRVDGWTVPHTAQRFESAWTIVAQNNGLSAN